MSSSPIAGGRRDAPAASAAPAANTEAASFGSDAIADMLRALGIRYVALNPGASFRGLHDSLVNHLGNAEPGMLLCLHEEHAVAIAHGYAKVAGEPIAAIVHANVGLMHASMAIFDAYCDRVPVLVLGATGPVDAAKRRPWIDWIHTSRDQGALVRPFVKWDDQPASVPAAQEALLRAMQIARTAPMGPVYVNFDATVQEAPLPSPARLPDIARYRPMPSPEASPARLDEAAALLRAGKRVVILAGRVNRDPDAWKRRVALAETLGARVLTDLKVGAAFPTDHPLHVGAPAFFLTPPVAETLRGADVVLSLDWLDLGGTLRQAWADAPVSARVIHASLDQYVHNGWSMDHQGLPPVDVTLTCEPDGAVEALLARLAGDRRGAATEAAAEAPLAPIDDGRELTVAHIARALRHVTAGRDVSLLRLPLGWSGELWPFRHPLEYLGYDGGGGIGSGPGMAVGSALALKGSGRLPVAILGDGDTLMGISAFWTAANARIPLLVIVANNRSYYNDEVHQERVARERKRPVENRWIGQRIADPDPDLATVARGLGLRGWGPVADAAALEAALREAVAAVAAGGQALVDVRIAAGYSPAMAAGVAGQR
jgi:thiamine pyrophosphate-dependent acetolactate synthase large subunit-like protein